MAALVEGEGNNNGQVVFKNCPRFSDCGSKINNRKIDNAKDIDVVMPMYDLIESCDNF